MCGHMRDVCVCVCVCVCTVKCMSECMWCGVWGNIMYKMYMCMCVHACDVCGGEGDICYVCRLSTQPSDILSITYSFHIRTMSYMTTHYNKLKLGLFTTV